MPRESAAPGHGWGRQGTNPHLTQRQSAMCCSANGHILSQQKIKFAAKIRVFRQFGTWTVSLRKNLTLRNTTALTASVSSSGAHQLNLKVFKRNLTQMAPAGRGTQGSAFGPPWEDTGGAATRGTLANISWENTFWADIWLWMQCLNISIFHDCFTAGKNEIHLSCRTIMKLNFYGTLGERGHSLKKNLLTTVKNTTRIS